MAGLIAGKPAPTVTELDANFAADIKPVGAGLPAIGRDAV